MMESTEILRDLMMAMDLSNTGNPLQLIADSIVPGLRWWLCVNRKPEFYYLITAALFAAIAAFSASLL
jgi:hypothetical protein